MIRSLRLLRLCRAAGLGLALVAVSCSGADDPVEAPDFSLTDENPASPTQGQTRQLSAARGRVLILHFALYT